MSKALQLIAAFWPIAIVFVGCVGGSAAFYLNVLKIRELQRKLRKEDEERKKSYIILPNTEEVQRYSKKKWETAVIRARSINIAIVLIVIAALPFGYYYLKQISFPVALNSKNMHVEFEITYPQNGDKVGPSVIVRGKSDVRNKNLYLIVVPLETGVRYVVDGPLTVDTTGSWSGRARFGEEHKGIREHFLVGVLATRLKLSEGALATLPLDSQMSNSVEVERIK